MYRLYSAIHVGIRWKIRTQDNCLCVLRRKSVQYKTIILYWKLARTRAASGDRLAWFVWRPITDIIAAAACSALIDEWLSSAVFTGVARCDVSLSNANQYVALKLAYRYARLNSRHSSNDLVCSSIRCSDCVSLGGFLWRGGRRSLHDWISDISLKGDVV